MLVHNLTKWMTTSITFTCSSKSSHEGNSFGLVWAALFFSSLHPTFTRFGQQLPHGLLANFLDFYGCLAPWFQYENDMELNRDLHSAHDLGRVRRFDDKRPSWKAHTTSIVIFHEGALYIWALFLPQVPWLQSPTIFDIRTRPRSISSITGTKGVYAFATFFPWHSHMREIAAAEVHATELQEKATNLPKCLMHACNQGSLSWNYIVNIHGVTSCLDRKW